MNLASRLIVLIGLLLPLGMAWADPLEQVQAFTEKNAALDHLRTVRRHAGLRATDVNTPATGAPDGALHDSIAVAFRRLPPKLQVAATLALVEQQPYAVIADALNVPVGTVKSRVFRAIRALRKELADLGVRA